MNDSPLMSLDDIAALHRCSTRHARDVIVKMVGFPKECPTSTPRHRRWLREDVMAFLRRLPSHADAPSVA